MTNSKSLPVAASWNGFSSEGETATKTSRQPFQRALAQQSPCVFDALKEAIQGGHPNEENKSQAADPFGVSPLVVRTTLVTQGELDRSASVIVMQPSIPLRQRKKVVYG